MFTQEEETPKDDAAVTWAMLMKNGQPYFNSLYIKEDGPGSNRYGKGVRLSRQATYQRTGMANPPYSDALGGANDGSKFIFITTKKPPPPNIMIYIKALNAASFGNFHIPFPWFKWEDYGNMFKYLESIGYIAIGEDFTAEKLQQFISPSIYMVENGNTKPLATVVSTMMGFSYNYALVADLYSKKNYEPFTQLEWSSQGKVKIIKWVNELVDAYYEICTLYMLKPPYCELVTEDVYNSVAQYCDEYTKNPNQCIPIGNKLIDYFFRTQRRILQYIVIYNDLYPVFHDMAAKTSGHWGAVLTLSFYKCLSTRGSTFNSVMKNWGIKMQPTFLVNVAVKIKISYEAYGSTVATFYPPPSEDITNLMILLADTLSTGSGYVPIKSLLLVEQFFKSINVNPIQTSEIDYKALIEELRYPKTAYLNSQNLDELMTVFYYYIKIVKERSKNFKKKREEWVWNKNGQTKQQLEDLERKKGPFDSAYIRKRWPAPWDILDEDQDEFEAYVDYLAPCPGRRGRAPAEDDYTFKRKCAAAVSDYNLWRDNLWLYRKKLKICSIGAPLTSVDDNLKLEDPSGNKYEQTVWNYFPDYGVWDPTPGASGWEKIIYFFTNMWTSVFGVTLVEWLISTAAQVAQLAVKLFKIVVEAAKDVLGTLSSALLLPALAVVAVLIVINPTALQKITGPGKTITASDKKRKRKDESSDSEEEEEEEDESEKHFKKKQKLKKLYG